MTPEQREELVTRLATNIVESMDMDDLVEYAQDRMTEFLQSQTDEYLEEESEIMDYYLLWH